MQTGVVAFAVFTVLLAVIGWRRSPPGWVVVGALVATLALYLVARLEDPGAPGILIAPLLSNGALVAAVFVVRHPFLVAALGAVPIGLCELSLPFTVSTVETIGPGLASAVAGFTFVRIVTRMNEKNLESARALTRARQHAAEQEARLAAHRDAQSLLHDHILAALRAVSSASTRYDDVDAGAAGAWRLLVRAEASQETSAQDLLSALLSPPATRLELEVEDLRSGELLLPANVRAAISDAAREVLRNVERHAGVDRAWVRLSGTADEVVLRVQDRGSGFDPRRVGSSSYGLRDSVARRLVEVGGEAEITSRPGQGTTVVLRWRRPGSERTAGSASSQPDRTETTHELAMALGDPRVAAAVAIGPFAVLAGGWGVAGLVGGQPPWLGGWALALVIASTAVLYRGERRASGAWILLLEVLAIGGSVGYLAQAPAGALTSPRAWPLSLAALAVGVIALFKGGWRAAGTTLGLVGPIILFAFLTTPGREPAALVPALPTILSVCWPLIVAATMRALLIALAMRYAEQLELTRGELARETAVLQRQMEFDRRLTHLRAMLAPVLGAIARGEISSRDPVARRESAAAEQAMRDELMVPGVLTPQLTRAIRAMRDRGAEVSLMTTSDLVDDPELVRRLLRAALLGDLSIRRLSLSLPPGGSVTLLAELDDESECDQLIEALELEVADATVSTIDNTVVARLGVPAEAR